MKKCWKKSKKIFTEFLVVHNGIITNYREIKAYLVKKGYAFESETDTEVIAKLIQHIAETYPHYSFRQLVEATITQLVSFFVKERQRRKVNVVKAKKTLSFFDYIYSLSF